MKGYHGYAPKWQAKDDGSQITSPLPAFSFNAEEPKTHRISPSISSSILPTFYKLTEGCSLISSIFYKAHIALWLYFFYPGLILAFFPPPPYNLCGLWRVKTPIIT